MLHGMRFVDVTLAAPAGDGQYRAEHQPHRRALFDGDHHQAAVVQAGAGHAQVERATEHRRVDDRQLDELDLLVAAVVVQGAGERPVPAQRAHAGDRVGEPTEPAA